MASIFYVFILFLRLIIKNIGQNDIQAPYQTYIGSQRSQLEEMTAILDTNTWTWRIPKSSIYQPFPQSHSSISLINDTKIVFGFGKY